MSDVAPPTEPARFWEDRYRSSTRVWSGRPNELLVREVAELPPGTALDLGCGEGGDALWLASRGWRVTGVDISATALERAAAHADAAGVGRLTTWERHELGVTFPEGSYDLVGAQYLQSPVGLDQDDILRRAAAAVAPGGTLVVVLHSNWPSWQLTPPFQVAFPTLDGLLDTLRLPAGEWTVVTRDTVRRPAVSPEGETGTRDDHVWRLRRAAGLTNAPGR
ncbi:class I SAM-dependent methyltransferase [Streptomyces sp. NPDC008313]|uniref:class I SAM-dependent methyltransferase n=1 Tax=Streptomyces sp. NPDC008313 TaxID=3364826 RepID=UPI0036E09827